MGRLGDPPGRDHGADGMAIPDRLAEGDDVRHDPLRLERPEVGAHAAEAHLHLVRYAHAARLPDVLVGFVKVAVGKNDLAGTAEHRLAEERGDFPSVGARSGDLIRHSGRIPRGALGIPVTVRAPVAVGHRRYPHVRRSSLATGPLELVRTDLDQPRRVPVVCALHDDHVPTTGGGTRQPQGKLVRLAPGADEEADLEIPGHRFREAPCVLDQVVVQVPGVRVEGRHLAGGRVHHPGVAVPDVADVVDAIQVRASLFIEEILPLAADDLERLPVRDAQRPTEVALPEPEDLSRLHASDRTHAPASSAPISSPSSVLRRSSRRQAGASLTVR